MKNFPRAALVALAFCGSAAAQEFWAISTPFTPAEDEKTSISFHVGEYFNGIEVAVSAANTNMLRVYSATWSQDFLSQLPDGKVLQGLEFVPPRAGTYLVAYDSEPTIVTLSAERFHAYLHDEGLDSVIREREAKGKAAEPGRERYRRNVKTLLRTAGKSDGTYAVLTGQRLEMTPLTDPYAKHTGDKLGLRITFDGKPLGGALVKAWHKVDTQQTLMIRGRTAENGRIGFSLPYAGTWMFSVVHMIPSEDATDADWDSYWGNFTFALPEKGGRGR